jgi:hypothetical protein
MNPHLTPQLKALMRLEIQSILRSRIGKDAAITRPDLLATLRARGYPTDDRRVREALEFIRTNTESGAWICSDNSGTGYWHAASEDELREYLTSERNRGLSILSKTSAQAKRALPALAGQFEIEEAPRA